MFAVLFLFCFVCFVRLKFKVFPNFQIFSCENVHKMHKMVKLFGTKTMRMSQTIAKQHQSKTANHIFEQRFSPGEEHAKICS